MLGVDQLHGAQRILRAHGVVVTNGQDCQIDALFADQAHIAEQTRIAGHVDFPAAVGGQQKAGRIAAVGAIGQGRTVQRQGQFQIAEGVFEAAAQVLGMRLLHALAGEPVDNLKVADHRGAGALGDADRIADMVAVPVRDEDKVRLNLVGPDAGNRVAGEEWVDQDFKPAGLQAEGSMSIPGEFEVHCGLRA